MLSCLIESLDDSIVRSGLFYRRGRRERAAESAQKEPELSKTTRDFID